VLDSQIFKDIDKIARLYHCGTVSALCSQVAVLQRPGIYMVCLHDLSSQDPLLQIAEQRLNVHSYEFN